MDDDARRHDAFALYVHVPWCRHVCPYCDFNVHATSAAPEREYAAAVAAEIATYAGDPVWRGRRADSVYLGGGTPSLFSPAAIETILDAAARGFGLAPDAEVTIEANPGTVDEARLAAYRALGIDRLSLGAQSFDARHLRTLGRDHGVPETAAAVAAARAAGFANVSLDLIFAVPGQTPAEWEDDLAAAIALRPDHVSAYGLTFEDGTALHAWRARGRLAAVDEDDEAAMAEATARLLGDAGFVRYEISSWARPGFACRHNVRYWDGSDYLGVGAGAHAFCARPAPGRRWTNERRPEAYVAAARTGGRAIASEEHLGEAQARAEFCFTGLRRLAGVDAAAFERRFGIALAAAFPVVEILVAEGLVETSGARLRLTPLGLRWADTVAARFV